MAAANQHLIHASCPGCGAGYDFPAAMAGRQGRCASCSTTFAVPTSPATSPNKQAAVTATRGTIFDEEEQESSPQYIPVVCRVCQTLYYGQPDQIGKILKCPDCDARNKVPPPPKPKTKIIPEAMEGEQYELWDADVQPLPAAMLAAQPKYIAVKCRHCDTMMYATEKQIGQAITCPDCGKTHTVPVPAQPKRKRSVLAADAPRLDPAFAPVERPPVLTPEAQQKIEAELDATPYGQALAESRRTGKPLTVDSRGRPILPRWPLVSGVVPFLISPGVPVRWLALSAGLAVSISVLLFGLAMAASGGMGALVGMCFFAIGCVLTLVSAAITTSTLLVIISESSDGNKHVQAWPRFLDSMGDFFLFAVAGMVSAFPGWLVGFIVFQQIEHKVLSVAASVLLCFPVILLSQLDISSIWAVVSPKVLRSILRRPFSWLTFYVESALITAACLAAAYTGILWLLVPVAVAALILYARLLGRLGWRLAEGL
jgi:DNA-directed RNA polymerase subunit M/transcription elongation factor TFIIS